MSNSPFKMPGMTFFGPEVVKPVKPQTAKQAAKANKKRRNLILSATDSLKKKKLTKPVKTKEGVKTSTKSKKSKTPNIEVGPPVMGIGYK